MMDARIMRAPQRFFRGPAAKRYTGRAEKLGMKYT